MTVPMGFMADIQMPVGHTFAGSACSDDRILDPAWAYERAALWSEAPSFVPLPEG